MNKWTDEEKNFIIDEFKSGKTIDKIHNMGKIKRSRYAIECKLYSHIYDMLQNGQSHKNIAKEFNKTKDEIKEIEKKAFDMKNKSDVVTTYTNDGGYKYQKSNNDMIDLNNFYHLNRTMNAVLSYYENIERLSKLKKHNIIDEDFYDKLMEKLNKFNFDKNKIIDSLIVKDKDLSKNKLDNIDENSVDSVDSVDDVDDVNKEDNKPIKKQNNYKNNYKNSDNDNDNYVKKITKRIR